MGDILLQTITLAVDFYSLTEKLAILWKLRYYIIECCQFLLLCLGIQLKASHMQGKPTTS